LRLLTILLVIALVPACSDKADNETLAPEVIQLGVLPDQSKEALIAEYSPLVDYLSRQTSLDIELAIPADYTALVKDFQDGRIHIANFGGLTFTEVERAADAEPLVMRDADLNFASCYLVAGSERRRSVREFGGEAFAFGPELSTSGHLMPRYYLKASGLDPDSFFASTRHSAGHDETATWVRDGVVPIAVANCVILQSMMADGRLQSNEVRVLETTPAYGNYVWAVQAKLDKSLKLRLGDAFLALDVLNPEHQAILRRLGATAYLPASRADFDDVRRAVQEARASAIPR
jgi:phosphonate transport system substrate-binding protein